MEDMLLVLRCKRGGAGAMARIYEKYRKDLLILAIALLNDKAAAEDTVHDVFVGFAERLAGFRLTGSLRAYTDVGHVGDDLPEEPLLTGLKVVAEFFDGVFPPVIELPQLQQAIRQYIKDKGLSEEEVEQRLLPVSEYWTKAIWYINGLKHTQRVKDLQYVGAGVQLGDAATAIMWWQPEDASTYQVIYGDLRVETVSADALVELMNSLDQ